MNEEFETYWNNLSEENKELVKEIVIERIRRIPDNFRISIG